MDRLFRAAAFEFAELADRDLAEVLSVLAFRLADDLRACELLIERNYTVQAMTAAASLMECSLLLRYISMDPKRATDWAHHDSLAKMPWPVAEMIRKVNPGPGLRDVNKRLYAVLAAAKHHNAKVLESMVKSRSLDQHLINSDPAIETRLPRSIQLYLSIILTFAHDAAQALSEDSRLSNAWRLQLLKWQAKHLEVATEFYHELARAMRVRSEAEGPKAG